ncbi:MAG: type II toxin-antitoxin system VapC family toxin [Candidatus Kerfeldbacteria bacterium]|nr:type II toxin-antitoxin system VapC family toxin [Candidatus Kerfeldbacteria bacterium]
MGQVTAFDSSIFVYLLESHRRYYSTVRKLFLEVESGENQGIFANIGLIELLTGPKQLGRYDIAYEYKNYIQNFPNLIITELNEPIVNFASDLRGRYRIKTPDAVHLASAIVYGADVFITNDKALKKVREVAVKVL